MKTKREASQLGIVSYDTALKALEGYGTIHLCNNTTLHKYLLVASEGYEPSKCAISIRLHSTDVVTYYPDGSIRLDSGGYRTVTTKDRINRFSPIRVWSKNWEWYAQDTRYVWEQEQEYLDGMVFAKPNVLNLSPEQMK